MRKELLDELMIISEEEKKYKSGQSTVEQSLYAKDNLTEIDRKKITAAWKADYGTSTQPVCGFPGA